MLKNAALEVGLRAALRGMYRVRVVGLENLPRRGPAVLASNHVSGLDVLLIWLYSRAAPRFLLPQAEYEWLGWVARWMRAIPIPGGEGPGLGEALQEAREELARGGTVGVFPEGVISRTGHLLPFSPDVSRVVAGTGAPVIPVYLEGLSGGLFSYWDGKLVRRPRRLRRPVIVQFGRAVAPNATLSQLRHAIMELGAVAAGRWHGPRDRLERRFIAAAKRNWAQLALADSGGRELSYGRALTASVLLARWLRRMRPAEPMIGILLPACAAAALANMAVLMSGKVPVNLNFTAGREAMQSAIEKCGLKTLLSSRQFLEKVSLPGLAGIVLLEDVSGAFTKLQKAAAAIAVRLTPGRVLERLYGGRSVDELATVIFSSGSTAEPKGVMLSHRNIISNLDSLRRIFILSRRECVVGVLPFFHVFGFTCTLCFPLAYGLAAVYHPNPIEARAVGELTARYQGTLLIATPTFFGHYLRRCSPQEFSSLRYAISGGEKLPRALVCAFQDKFGLPLLEGYGTTELSPVVAVNVPDLEGEGLVQQGHKPGSVGRPIPGVAVRVLEPSTGEALPAGAEGMLAVRGPGCMLGYLGNPQRTAEVLREGWYLTGDIGALDEEGFLYVSDRLSRFSKIGGEMVPHMRLEEQISQLLDGTPCVVTSLPDPERGERLVVLYTRRDVSPAEIWSSLQRSSLPKLWLPKRENICWVEELPPPLPSGKLDLRRVKQLAAECMKRSDAGRG